MRDAPAPCIREKHSADREQGRATFAIRREGTPAASVWVAACLVLGFASGCGGANAESAPPTCITSAPMPDQGTLV